MHYFKLNVSFGDPEEMRSLREGLEPCRRLCEFLFGDQTTTVKTTDFSTGQCTQSRESSRRRIPTVLLNIQDKLDGICRPHTTYVDRRHAWPTNGRTSVTYRAIGVEGETASDFMMHFERSVCCSCRKTENMWHTRLLHQYDLHWSNRATIWRSADIPCVW